MDYIMTMRVFQADEGWTYEISFKSDAFIDTVRTTTARRYRSEQTASVAAIKVLPSAITAFRRRAAAAKAGRT